MPCKEVMSLDTIWLDPGIPEFPELKGMCGMVVFNLEQKP